MKIGFYAQNCIPIHAGTLDERPLGGTETGLIRVAEILARRGHEVLVFTAHQNPPQPPRVPPNLRYLHFSHAPRMQPYDVLVQVKDWRGAFFSVEARVHLYWTGDGQEQYINFGLGDARVVRKFAAMLAVSTWQAETMCAASGFPREKTVIIGNGVHLPYYQGSEPRTRHRLIYTSAPYRGLQHVPAMYSALKQSFPALELHIFAGMSLYDTERPFQGPHVESYERLKQILVRLPGVVIHGNVTQAVLAREYMRSSLLFYPNSTFETCCITALESQLAGCPVLASANSALPETVGEGGAVIQGEPGTEHYARAFVGTAARFLSDDALWHAASERARQRILDTATWEHVTTRFERIFSGGR